MTKINELRNIIADAHKQIAEIQEGCSHPAPCVTSEYWSATDEYGTDVVASGYNHDCSLCEKRWGTSGRDYNESR